MFVCCVWCVVVCLCCLLLYFWGCSFCVGLCWCWRVAFLLFDVIVMLLWVYWCCEFIVVIILCIMFISWFCLFSLRLYVKSCSVWFVLCWCCLGIFVYCFWYLIAFDSHIFFVCVSCGVCFFVVVVYHIIISCMPWFSCVFVCLVCLRCIFGGVFLYVLVWLAVVLSFLCLCFRCFVVLWCIYIVCFVCGCCYCELYAHGVYAIVLSVCVFVLFTFVLLGVFFMHVLCWWCLVVFSILLCCRSLFFRLSCIIWSCLYVCVVWVCLIGLHTFVYCGLCF